MCKSIDSKIDKVFARLDQFETQLDTLTQLTQDMHDTQDINGTHTHEDDSSTHKTKKTNITIKTKKKKKRSSPQSSTTSSTPSKTPVPACEKSGSIKMELYSDKALVTGDTYNKKMFIKKYKGQWSPEHRGWIVFNTHNISELKSNLKRISATFESTTYSHRLDGSTSVQSSKDSTTVDDDPSDSGMGGYAFINDS